MAPDNRFGRLVAKTIGEAAPADVVETPPAAPFMRLELREVEGLDVARPLVLAGVWAWLLFNEAGGLISYSDGYATRAACHAAAKQIAWPINVFE
ncbi:hypothetical protein [Sphingomonas sp. R86520]|uniref:hypothetical protein n=1 Tax=Sphingomonas sp. R86520 TaxID=3093859 RepID=UPI0036D3A02C